MTEARERTQFQRVAQAVDRLCHHIDFAVRAALVFFAGLILSLLILQVVMRYLIRTPLIWVEELSSYTLAFLVLWGAACYVRSWQHIRVDTFYNLFPYRVRAGIAVGLNLLIVYFGYLLLMAGHQLALLGAGDLSDSGIFNLYWPRQAMTSGGALIMLQAANNILRVLAGEADAILAPKSEP
jgi:TRAP-type C4-dicarboxylate transport system permease small subunit